MKILQPNNHVEVSRLLSETRIVMINGVNMLMKNVPIYSKDKPKWRYKLYYPTPICGYVKTVDGDIVDIQNEWSHVGEMTHRNMFWHTFGVNKRHEKTLLENSTVIDNKINDQLIGKTVYDSYLSLWRQHIFGLFTPGIVMSNSVIALPIIMSTEIHRHNANMYRKKILNTTNNGNIAPSDSSSESWGNKNHQWWIGDSVMLSDELSKLLSKSMIVIKNDSKILPIENCGGVWDQALSDMVLHKITNTYQRKEYMYKIKTSRQPGIEYFDPRYIDNYTWDNLHSGDGNVKVIKKSFDYRDDKLYTHGSKMFIENNSDLYYDMSVLARYDWGLS